MRDKQKRFCQEYLIDSDATKAAVRAGYAKRSAASIGCDLLKHPEVKAYLTTLQEELKERSMVKAEDVLAELWKVGKARFDNLVQWDKAGNMTIVSSEEASDDVKAGLMSMKRVDTETGGYVEIKMHDKVAALDKLARALGMYQDKVDVTSNGHELPVPVIMLAQEMTVNG